MQIYIVHGIEPMYSPLEQFTIVSIVPMHIGKFYFSITNSAVFMLLSVGVLLFFAQQALNTPKVLPTSWQSVYEMMYEFVSGLLDEQVGEKGKPYFTIIFTTFSFVLCCNLVGMIPYSFTVTSHFVITFSLSFMIFIGVTFIGFEKHGMHYLSFFLPPGAPLALSPFLVVIELISYAFRGISLGVRLFANMMAGHTLLKILSGFAWSMLTLGGVLSIASVVPLAVVFALTFLEVGVACLQAYVFTILTCIYLNDAIHLH